MGYPSKSPSGPLEFFVQETAFVFLPCMAEKLWRATVGLTEKNIWGLAHKIPLEAHERYH